jgi:hypothetical protein
VWGDPDLAKPFAAALVDPVGGPGRVVDERDADVEIADFLA